MTSPAPPAAPTVPDAHTPPAAIDRPPHRTLLPARTVLWRVHSCRRTVNGFRPADGSGADSGRFGGTAEDPFPFLYGSTEQSTAIAERLLRSHEFDGRGYRLLARMSLRDQRLSAMETTAELVLISLVTAVNLAAIGQDDWLVQAEPRDFGRTREWARWLRRVDSSAQGLIWQSRRDRPRDSVVLFGDRCPDHALAPMPDSTIELDSPDGMTWLQQLLRPYYVSLEVSLKAVAETRIPATRRSALPQHEGRPGDTASLSR